MCYIEDLENLSRVALRIPWTVSAETALSEEYRLVTEPTILSRGY